LIFVSLMFFKMSVQTAIMIMWKINHSEIEKLYCENKDNPLMHCEGKCYLSKQLKQIELDFQKSKTPIHEKLVKSIEINLFCEKIETLQILTADTILNAVKGGFYLNFYEEKNINSYFHPPNMLSFPA